jgi:ABC-type transport system involved in cytochrome c biogenesis permease subunit
MELVFHFFSIGFLCLSIFGFRLGNKELGGIKNLGSIGANLSLTVLLIWRWVHLHHFPISGLYESLLFLTWVLLTIEIYLSNEKISPIILDLGSLILPFILFLDSFALFQLPLTLRISSPLVPALQSNWLLMHVTFMISSYGLLIAGSLFAISFLVV